MAKFMPHPLHRMLCADISLVVCTVIDIYIYGTLLCMVMIADRIRAFRSLNLANLVRYRREPCTDVCKKRKHGGTSVVHVNVLAWAREVMSSSCGNQVVIINIMARNEREMCNYTLHSCISITDQVKIYKSIDIKIEAN